MNTRIKTTYLFFSFLGLLLAFSCGNKERKSSVQKIQSPQDGGQKDYLSLIIALDTSSTASIKKRIKKECDFLQNTTDKEQNPYYHYFRAKKFSSEKRADSALSEYLKMKGAAANDDVELLKQLGTLSVNMSNGSMVESKLMTQILSGLEIAERVKSRLTYRFYDLMAQAYFQNHNEKKSLEYASLYYNHHPFKTHPVIKQRYFDISFLLASRLGDFKKMTFYNGQARLLAQKIGDSMALARTFDNEAQIYSRQMQLDKALVSSKIYFNYLKKTNNLNDVAYNNLATTFVRSNQPDSAIYYYKKGIELEKKDLSGKQKNVHYQGLIDAYKMKGDYARALEASDSVYRIELRNNKAIEAVKIAELHEVYETEKKDQNIAQLNSRNKLNETIIKQQRSTIFLVSLIFVGVLSFFIVIYRQQRLREKNKLLISDNQRLNMEQKMLQAQLNPHFIFNAIANLQGLVASGHIDESVRYLKSFSSLLRSILEQNRKDFIEIEEEVSSLNNYILVQQMRYDDAFDYEIVVDDELDVNETLIPPMLIQPFVENAIEHGFRNTTYKGFLKITFKLENNALSIEIDDNGSGLTQKVAEKQQKKSLAQIIIRERFDLLFLSKGQHATFKVADKKGPNEKGVLAKITIPIITD